MAGRILGTLTALIWAGEMARKASTRFNQFFLQNFGSLLRDSEHNTMTGTSYYFLGVTSSIILFHPRVAIASILCCKCPSSSPLSVSSPSAHALTHRYPHTYTFLPVVLGDGGAALAGVSFGKIKIAGKKTLRGTLAMFFISLTIGIILYWDAQVFEILALVGALCATLAELIPLDIDDNLTIPLLTGLGVHIAAARIGVTIPAF
eukprot:TRINITY_DN339_c0_g1_i4.p1 TRINITY_DN339_c0_g1~~TRINITY_DN339_c0_g1_i4.p1  ORF type:complete len:205 (+),score=29.08 TRINITY_DN339_c0_g1_i4:716-1330(+)